MCLTILKRAQEGNTPQEEGGEVVMPKRTKEDYLGYIEELGYRFPDISDDAVLIIFDEYADPLLGFVSKFSPTGRAILAAYEKGVNKYYDV